MCAGKKVEHYLFNFLPPVEVFVGGPSGWADPPHSLVDGPILLFFTPMDHKFQFRRNPIPFLSELILAEVFFTIGYGLSDLHMRERRGERDEY